MEFGLTKRVAGSSSFLSITAEEFKALAAASEGHLSTLFVEEKFDLLIENYLELENAMLDSIGRHMVHQDQDYEWFQVERNLFNRRLVNLLSACRSYVDYSKHYIRNVLPGDQQASSQIESAFSKHYDALLGYRVMEALRNFVQHRGFPIHAVSYSGKLLGSKIAPKLRFGLSVFTKTIYLHDEKFKKKVFEELEALGGRVDLKPFIREYVGALSDVHEQLRNLMKPSLEKWDAAFDQALLRFKTAFPAENSLAGLSAVQKGAEDRIAIGIFRESIEYRKALQKKNRMLAGLERRYVTGETISD